MIQYKHVASVQYGYRIAPPTLVATVIALNSSLHFMLGMYQLNLHYRTGSDHNNRKSFFNIPFINTLYKTFKGQGIGGFVGGQLVDRLGCSLPLLFNITAGFLFGWAVMLYLVYRFLCKKYEDKLIKQKEDEIRNMNTAGSVPSLTTSDQNADDKSFNASEDGKSQIAGIASL